MQHWMEQRQPVDGRGLLELLLSTASAAENFTGLARCFRGWQAEALGRMARECRAQGACLGGIFTLVSGEPPKKQTVPTDPGTVQARLKKAYVRSMQLLSACQARAADAEYGPVFQILAARQQEHCRKILEILGSL